MENQHDVSCLLESNQEGDSWILAGLELDILWQNQNIMNDNHASQLSEASLRIKREPDDLHERQSSDAGHDVSESNEQKRSMSCKSVNDSEKTSSYPGVPAQDSDQNQLFHLTRHEEAMGKLLPRQKMDTAIQRTLSNQESILPRENPDFAFQISEICNREKEMTSNNMLPVKGFSAVPASQSHEQTSTYSTGPEKALEKLQPRGNIDGEGCSSRSVQESIPSSVSKKLLVIPKDEPTSNDLQPNHCLDDGNNELVSKGEKYTTIEKETVSENQLHIPSLSIEVISEFDQQEFTNRAEKLKPRRNIDGGGSSSQSDQESIISSVSKKLPVIAKDEPTCNDWQPNHCLVDGNHELVSKGEKYATIEKETVSENQLHIPSLSIEVPISEFDQQEFTNKAEKLQPMRSPDPGVQESQSDLRSIPSKLQEKGLNDGYNWRKYGQKFVKGFNRSYYRCTYPICQAKKQVERLHDGYTTVVNYFGNHQHHKPQQSHRVASNFEVRTREIPILTVSNADAELIIARADVHQHIDVTETPGPSAVPRSGDSVADVVSQSNVVSNDKDDRPDSKRQYAHREANFLHLQFHNQNFMGQLFSHGGSCHCNRKREISVGDDTLLNKPNGESRHVVQTLSDVDVVNDGYRWRKYGQKLVRGNPNPRSYYRCSNAGCPAKKYVERGSHDLKVVVTRYDGKHDHGIPTCTAANENTTGSDASVVTANGERRLKPGENKLVGLQTAL